MRRGIHCLKSCLPRQPDQYQYRKAEQRRAGKKTGVTVSIDEFTTESSDEFWQ